MTRKKNFLFILDLDNTLITSGSEKNINQLNTKVDVDIDNTVVNLKPKYVFFRPYLNEFLEYLTKNFYVAIWSAALDKWVNHIIFNSPIKKYYQDFLFIWTKEECSTIKEKKLKNVWEFYPNFNEKNTMLIDDFIIMGNANLNNQLIIRQYSINDSMTDDKELKNILDIINQNKYKLRNIKKIKSIYETQTYNYTISIKKIM
jgi:hypothetical protein